MRCVCGLSFSLSASLALSEPRRLPRRAVWARERSNLAGAPNCPIPEEAAFLCAPTLLAMPVEDPRTQQEIAQALLKAAPPPAGGGEFPVDCGTINFTVHRIPSNPEFVKCRPWANKQLLVNHAWESWGLEPYPGVLVRVTGSIDGVVDDNRAALEDVTEGLIKAAHIAKGWLFSTGLDFGVSGLVGSIVARNRHVCEAPLIGVAAWRTVQGKEQLMVTPKGGPAEKGDKRNYADAEPSADMDKISLQPNYTVRARAGPVSQ